MLVPEEGRRLPLQVRDKGFPKARALRPLRPPSRQPRPSPCCSQSQHTAPSLSVAPGADSSSPRCWRASHSRGHPHAALPTMQLPSLPWPDWTLAYPKMRPLGANSPRLLRPSPPGRPTSIPCLQPPPQPGSGLAAGSQEGVGQVSRLRAASFPVPPAGRPAHARPATPPSTLFRCSAAASRGRCILS